MPDAGLSSSVDRLRRVLKAAASATGGWPYYAGKSSRIEPTAWALLALAATDPARPKDEGESSTRDDSVAAPHLAWLRARQRADGLLVDVAADTPNFTANGTAACVLARLDRERAARDKLLGALVLSKGVSISNPDPRQNNALQGWPWIADTFSWIEPTAWCALALKMTRGTRGAEARIQEAEKLIVNRSCDAGGWNYGNAAALGQDLRPYVPTTAVGLLAMQDRRSEEAVAKALGFLTRSAVQEPSAMALSLAAIALHIHGQQVDAVEERLLQDLDRAERLGNVQALAVMLFALTLADHDARGLRV
jgi:hypothetical protein